jgi:hypothetical protein
MKSERYHSTIPNALHQNLHTTHYTYIFVRFKGILTSPPRQSQSGRQRNAPQQASYDNYRLNEIYLQASNCTLSQMKPPTHAVVLNTRQHAPWNFLCSLPRSWLSVARFFWFSATPAKRFILITSPYVETTQNGFPAGALAWENCCCC